MNKIAKHTLYWIIGILFVSLFQACEKEDTWEPGPQTEPNNPGVYFDRNIPRIVELDADANKQLVQDYVLITLGRDKLKTSQAIQVPIKVKYADSNLTVPTTVNFEAGSATAELKVQIGEFELATPYSLSIEIDGRYTNTYASYSTTNEGGASNLDIKLEVVSVLCDATFTPTDYSGSSTPKFIPFKQKIYLNSDGSYTIKNFLFNNAGYNFDFEVDNNNNIIPLLSTGYHSADEQRWYFYSANADASANRIPCYIPGSNPADNVTYIYFYTWDNPSSYTAFWLNIAEKKGRMMGYSRYTVSSSGRIAFNISW